MKNQLINLVSIFAVISFLFVSSPAFGQTHKVIPDDARCPVCGMMVAKYPTWAATLTAPRGELFFDGVKDMIAYYHHPEMYGGQPGEQMVDILVLDYYKQEWIDGLKAYYVVGSDVLGPMGHEFIPFAAKDAAESFLSDHHGKKILTFDEISAEMVMKMKKAHKMKKKMMQQ